MDPSLLFDYCVTIISVLTVHHCNKLLEVHGLFIIQLHLNNTAARPAQVVRQVWHLPDHFSGVNPNKIAILAFTNYDLCKSPV